jgi:hypothetical protein
LTKAKKRPEKPAFFFIVVMVDYPQFRDQKVPPVGVGQPMPPLGRLPHGLFGS